MILTFGDIGENLQLSFNSTTLISETKQLFKNIAKTELKCQALKNVWVKRIN